MRRRIVVVGWFIAVLAAAAVDASCSSDEGTFDGGVSDGGDERVVGDASGGDAPTDAAIDTADLDAAASLDACATCASGSCSDGGCDPLVFVSSKNYPGALGDAGLLSADQECAALAAAAGLSGTYRAWLSAGDAGAPATRFTQKSSRPYRLRDGRQVAASYAALNATLDTAISVTEKGDDVGFSLVWTATNPAGDPLTGATDCAGWSSADGGDTGGTGESDDIVAEWTVYENVACSTRARLYCFEQRP